LAESTAGAVRIEPLQEAHLERVVTLNEKTQGGEQQDDVLKLGRGFARATYRFFLDDELGFGFVALHGDQVIGFVVGRLDEWGAALNRYRRGAVAAALLTRPWLLLEPFFVRRIRRAIVNRLPGHGDASASGTAAAPSPYGRVASLTYIGVDADFHHLRASGELLSHAEAYARERGLPYLRAQVHRSNVQSRFMYKRRKYAESQSPDDADTLLYHLKLQS
jgi:ribosomal protein S18 acetylase RimI-like enzyme